METRDHVDQFFRFEQGEGKVVIDAIEHNVKDGDTVIAPAGAKHNVVNTSNKDPLKLYAIYSPPEHQDKVVRHTKAEAELTLKSITANLQNKKRCIKIAKNVDTVVFEVCFTVYMSLPMT
jgi:oxalate decarboxylase/phosphoglucose isomerase-like protein (cupin superfamily)